MIVTVLIETSTEAGLKLILNFAAILMSFGWLNLTRMLKACLRMIQPSWHLTDQEKNMIVSICFKIIPVRITETLKIPVF